MKATILYIDDENQNLKNFRLVLGHLYNILLAENAVDAFQILEENEVSVVISDQRMPEMTGLELCEIIFNKYPDIVCMILTAYSDVEVTLQAINQEGIYRFMLKPWNKDEITISINNAIEAWQLRKENKLLIRDLKKTNQELFAHSEEIRTQNEELTIAKEKAEESDRLKTRFINNMSHEIRTPLNGILGFTSILDKENITKDEQKSYVEIINNCSNQLLKIIDDILEISLLESERVKTHDQKIILNALLSGLFTLFEQRAKENSTPLYVKKSLSDDKSTILTDGRKLKRILSNIIENSLKFTVKGFIEFGYKLIDNNIEIYVKDTGIGIKTENQKNIFDRFSKVEEALSTDMSGLGLGLSIAKENAKLLDWDISLESKKGKGSTFFLTIPYKPIDIEPKNEKTSDADKKATKDKYTILVAEDVEINYFVIETMIISKIKLDCNLIHAINGKEAVNICQKNSDIDIVFMDIKMPVMNGYIATEQIKKFRPELPVIAQTAYTTEADKEKALAAGCDHFISKPIKEEALKGIIKKYLII